MTSSDTPTYLSVTLLLMTSSCAGVTVIDLTYPYKMGENIAWPIYPPYNFTILTRGYSPVVAGGWLESNHIEMAEHTGTHMDAPSHFAKGHWRIHEIPASRLVGPAVVVDVTEQVNRDVDYAVTVQDLQDWEDQYGRIPDGAVVLMSSGWGRRYPDKKRVLHTQDPTDTSTFHFPGFSGEAVRWLVDNRDITALGADTPSPDVAQDTTFPVHRTLLNKDIMILENVGHVDKMPARGALVVIGAINIHDGSGSPMRLLALTDLESHFRGSNGVGGMTSCSLLVLVVLGIFVLAM